MHSVCDDLEVAMCSAAVLHRDLSLLARTEVALSGFLALDLYRMLSDARCSRLNLPKGSQFMAPQTLFNLQGLSLAVACIACSKDSNWHPWAVGSARLSELSVEEWFSHLRRQSPNAQLSARGFFQAASRQLLKHGRLLNKEKPMKRKESPCLSDAQLLCYC